MLRYGLIKALAWLNIYHPRPSMMRSRVCCARAIFEARNGAATSSDTWLSMVRVDISRLRAKLKEDYETGGRDEPIRIELPKGSYAVVFRASGHVVAHVIDDTAEAPVPSRRIPGKWIAAVAWHRRMPMRWSAMRSATASAPSMSSDSRLTGPRHSVAPARIPAPMVTRPPSSRCTAATASTKKWMAVRLPVSTRL